MGIELEQTAFEFAGFTLDSESRLLLDGEGKPIILTARAFDTLLFLLVHHGETVSKKQLMEAVWPNQIVEDNNLTQAISTVRKILGDKQDAGRIIATIPGRGYSCVAKVNSPAAIDVQKAGERSVAYPKAEQTGSTQPVSFFAELKRRNVFRVVAAYTIVSWLLIQIIVSIEGPLNLPSWFDTAIIVLLIIGLPIALLLAWAFELTPGGIKHAEEVDQSKSITKSPAQTLNTLAISGLVLIVLFFVVDSYFLDEAIGTGVGDVEEKSIAVLPFTDLSIEGDQGYFSDGLSEDILNKLAQVEDLLVIARTSSFYYKGRTEDVRVIGETLGVAYVLEGSVRKSSDQLLITAQLVNTSDGFQLWSDNFTGELADIFTFQVEIAEAVTTALSITIGAGEFNRPGMTQNIEAYEAYLRSLSGGPAAALEQIDHAERAVEIDPDFGIAWHSLARALTLTAYFLPPDQGAGVFERAGVAFATAQALAGDALEMQLVNAIELQASFDWIEAEQQYLHILNQFGLSAIGALEGLADLIGTMGRPEEALHMLERAKRLDPLSRRVSNTLARMLAITGKFDESLAEMERGLLLEENGEFTDLGGVELLITLETGDITDLANTLSERTGDTNPGVQALRNEDINAALQVLRDGFEDPAIPAGTKSGMVKLAAKLGGPELALEILIEYPGYGYGAEATLWMDHMREMRQLPGFKDYLRDAGFLTYWQTTGKWGDYCQPLPDGDDFECF